MEAHASAEMVLLWRLRGLSLLALGQLPQAFGALQAALALCDGQPKARAEVLNECAMVLLAQDQPAQAVPLLEQALTLLQGAPQGRGVVQSNLGNAYRRSGHLEQAVITLQEAVQNNPTAWERWNNLAMALVEQGGAYRCGSGFFAGDGSGFGV